MKKILFLILCFSTFLLFSCASKTDGENEEFSAPEVTDVNESKSPSDDKNNEQIQNEETELKVLDASINEEPSIDINTEDTEKENTDNFENSIQSDENLTEIEEPEIIELEPTEETDTKSESESLAETEEIPEVISAEDLITPEIEEIPETVDTANLPDDNENSSEINNENDEDEVITVIQDDDEVENLLAETEDDSAFENSKNETSENENNDEETDSEEEKYIIPSRSMSVKRLEYIDITYPGKGWVFMGLTDNSKNLTYLGRKIGTNDTKFTLQARNSGTYVLHFYKNDSVTNEYLDDYLEIIIAEEKDTAKIHIEAPKYIPLLPEQKKAYIEKVNAVEAESESQTQIPATEEKKTTNISQTSEITDEKTNNNQTEIINNEKIEETVKTSEKNDTKNLSDLNDSTQISNNDTVDNTNNAAYEETVPDSNELYEKGAIAYKLNNLKEAEQNFTLGMQYASSDKDKFLFWLGQTYEKESEIQNINKAIEEYTLLINNYPASSYWDKANKRIIYLKRFYIEGR